MRVSPPRRISGFTLIELMVAVVIAGILAAVAYPAYTSFIQRSRRADAMNALTAIVQSQERYRSNRSAYASSLEDLKDVDVAKLAPNYSFELVGVGAPAGFVSGYEVKATVNTTGAHAKQARDSSCATLGVRFQNTSLEYLATDSAGGDTRSLCWPR